VLEEAKKVHSEDFNETRLQLLEKSQEVSELRAKVEKLEREKLESEKRTVGMVEESRKLLEELRAERARTKS